MIEVCSQKYWRSRRQFLEEPLSIYGLTYPDWNLLALLDYMVEVRVEHHDPVALPGSPPDERQLSAAVQTVIDDQSGVEKNTTNNQLRLQFHDR